MPPLLKSHSKTIFTILNFFLAAILCIVLGKVTLLLFPVHVQVTSDTHHATIAVGNEVKEISFSSPMTHAYIVPLEKHKREFLIDGSSGFMYLTFDPAYFATFSATPYYRVQSFIRDESSYSSWKNLVLKDNNDTIFLKKNSPEDDVSFSLPQEFSLSIDLIRPELARVIAFTHSDDSITKIIVDRNGKFINIVSVAPNNTTEQRAKWYFPTDPLPFLAEIFYTLCNTVALAFILLAFLPLLASLMPKKAFHLPKKKLAASIIVLACSTLFFAGWYTTVALFDKSPYILDAMAYYFQAKIFAQGLWTAPTPALKEAFPIVFVVSQNGNWFSLFPPGASLVLALGFLLHIPWLTETILAVLTAILIYLIGKKLYNNTVALIALVLFAGSPFVHLQAASFLSHIPALFFAALSWYLFLVYLDKPLKRYLILGGLALGFTLLIREFTTVIYALTVGIFVLYSATKKYGHKRIQGHLVLTISVLIGMAIFYLYAYNYGFTGSIMEMPRHIGDPHDHWGFGKGVGFFGEHTVASGLGNADQQITTLIIHLFGWPYYFAVAFLFIPFITRKATSADYLSAVMILSYILIDIGYYYHSIAFGPRHYLEAIPALVFLTARGFVTLSESTSAVLHRMGLSSPKTRAAYAAGLLFMILTACNVLYYEPRQLAIYKNFADVGGAKDLEVNSFLPTGLEGRSSGLINSVIISDSWQIYNTYFGYLNCPTLNCATVYAFAPTDELRQKLFKAYPGRYFYDAVREGDSLILKPITSVREDEYEDDQ